ELRGAERDPGAEGVGDEGGGCGSTAEAEGRRGGGTREETSSCSGGGERTARGGHAVPVGRRRALLRHGLGAEPAGEEIQELAGLAQTALGQQGTAEPEGVGVRAVPGRGA